MIRSKKDYLIYLDADRIALGMSKWDLKLRLFDEVWSFERLLRKVEYYQNCETSILGKIYLYILKYALHRKSINLGFTIPPNVFGPGLSIAHAGTIVVASDAIIGSNCRLHVCTSIANDARMPGHCPRIGNNVYIGPGAKLFGKIEIADNIAIGANSVVNKSFLEPGISIAGVPAKKINDKGSSGMPYLKKIINR